MDLRYRGQAFELTVPVPNKPLSTGDWPGIAERFHKEHERAYGFSAPGEPLEVVNLRLVALGREAKPALPRLPHAEGRPEPRGRRSVCFPEVGWVECPCYAREALSASVELEGPAIVEGPDATVVLHPGHRARVDAYGNLIVSVPPQTQGPAKEVA